VFGDIGDTSKWCGFGCEEAIHVFLAQSPKDDVDARDKRDKPGHDDGER
jgi:hypothetical protein